MVNELVFNKSNSGVLSQLINELRYALKQLNEEELRKVFIETSKIAAKDTYQTKINSAKSISQFITKKFKDYKENGVIDSLSEDAYKIGSAIKELPENSKLLYSEFIIQPKEMKIEILIVTILTLSIFFTVGGGLDMEGGAPDLDTELLGIGMHRNIFSHTVLLGLGLEFVSRFGIQLISVLHQKLPTNHNKIWDIVNKFVLTHKELAVAAMWLGIGTHLLKDSGIITGGVKPYVGLPNGLPMEVHQGLFAANGLASGLFSIKK